MNAPLSELVGDLPGNVWRLWGDYWMDALGRIPPLYNRPLRTPTREAAGFICAMTPQELRPFLLKPVRGMRLKPLASAALSDMYWFGWWSGFVAVRQNVSASEQSSTSL